MVISGSQATTPPDPALPGTPIRNGNVTITTVAYNASQIQSISHKTHIGIFNMHTLPDPNAKRRRLRQRLGEPGLIVAPGVFEMISARMADRLGFDTLYMTGYGTVASYLGLPDAGIASYTDMVNRAGAFAQG